MALPGTPINWRPRGLTDSRDGTNAFSGAMRRLSNVIPDPSTAQLWQPRPAAQIKTDFTGGPPDAGTLSGRYISGELEYGLVPSSTTPGFDEPYCYDLAADAFLTVAGVTPDNVPLSPPSAGDWTPPIMCQIGSRILVTHPGFSGTGPLFTLTTTGNLDGTITITGNPDILGVLPGMSISGTGIPAGTTVVAVEYFQLNTTGDTHTNTTLDNLGSVNGVTVGQLVGGDDLPVGDVVASVDSTTQVTMVDAATGTGAGGRVTFRGAQITMSAPATATADGVTLTIAGHEVFFGWFDLSGFSLAGAGNTTSGSQVITGGTSPLGIQPGMLISGDNIPAGASVVATADIVIQTMATLAPPSPGASSVVNTQGVAPGMLVTGLGIPDGTFVTGITLGGQGLGLSQEPTASGTVLLTITGSTITMSDAATGSASLGNFLVEGGTRTAPLWGAGNTDRNPLMSIPVGVAEMNGRAWFANMFDGVPFSDSGVPCRMSNSSGVQVLTTGDGLPVTALGILQLATPIVGGIVEALVVFQGSARMHLINGDQATGNLKINALPESTGTDAPLSIVPIGGGRTAFVSPLGLRTVDINGSVSPPIGADGQGITQPFQNAVSPSQMCAAYNSGVLRITVQNGGANDSPFEEYWHDITRGIWHGPHSFPARLIQPWRNGFVVAPIGLPASLWSSEAFVTASSGFVENGVLLGWETETVLLPDNQAVAMNAMVEANLTCALDATAVLVVSALDENRSLLDGVLVGPGTGNVRQRGLYWTEPVIFKQMSIRVVGESKAATRLGNHYMRFETLGYSIDEVIDEEEFFLLAEDGVTIINAEDGATHLTPE